MRKDRVWKSNILFIITRLQKNGEKLEVVDRLYQPARGKDLDESLDMEEAVGIHHSIEVVNEPPQQFKIGTLYVSYDGKRIWTFVEVSK